MNILVRGAVADSWKAYLIVFSASACGLVLEIVAGRLLASTIGVSLYTWTSIIGVVLAGISVGSFAGGRVADRFPSPSTLGLVLIAGGISSLSVLPLIGIVSDAFIPLPLQARIVFVTGSLFFIPSLILGMVTPIVIKLQLKDLANVGKVVGKIYALSAAGSIFGTFITGFVLIQLVGSRYTLLLVAITLVVLALSLGNLWRVKPLGFGLLLVLLGLGAAGFTSGAYDSGCVRESNYFCIRVDDATLDGGRKVKALYLDKLLHSYVDVDDPTYLVYGYEKIFGEIVNYVAQKDPGFRVLLIGGGGYTMPRTIEELYPGSTIEVIEIDPEVTKIAFDHLGLRSDTRIVTYNQDARIAVPNLPKGRYGLVIGDAFNGVSVPYHLTTKEFNEQVKGLLNDEGIYAVNVIDKLHSGRFLRAFVNTLEQTFPYVLITRDVNQWETDRQHTFVVIGSLQPVSSSDLQSAWAEAGNDVSVSHSMPQVVFDSWIASQGKIILTDDYAPVDNLLAPIIRAGSRLSDAEQHYNAGAELQIQGRFYEAIAEYDKAIRLDPNDAFAYDNRGRSFAALNEFRKAIEDYDEAISLNPNFSQAFNNRGSSYKSLGQLQRALQDFDKAIDLKPGYALAYINRGVSQAGLGAYEQSIQDFGQAIRLDPGSALGYRNRGTSFLALGQLQSAIQDFDSAITLDPLDAATHNNRGIAYTKLGRFQQAIQDYNQVLILDPQHASAYNNRGTAYLNLNQEMLAIEDYEAAIRLNPQYGRAYNNRGTAYRGIGQYERAVQDFDEAIRLNPEDGTAYANRALTFTYLDLDSEAQQDVERAVGAGFSRDLLVQEIEEVKALR